MPPHTTLYLLGSFAYKKSLTRADLKLFFDALCGEHLDLKNDLKQYFPNRTIDANQEPIDNANPTHTKNWLTDSYDLKHLTAQEIGLLASKSEDTDSSSEDIEQLLVTGIVQNWITWNMPPMIDYGSIASKKYTYVAPSSDCMRTSIRSICNILAFDQKTQLFSIETLLENAPNATKELQNFYKTYPGKKCSDQSIIPYTAADLQDENLRMAWSDDVIKINIPYATYVELYTKNGTRVKNAPRETGPFAIYLPTDNSYLLNDKKPNKYGFYEQAIKIGDSTYDVYTPSSELLGFGFAPYTHTLIFILNYILGLNLFDGITIDKELIKTNFEKKYMEKLGHTKPFKDVTSNISSTVGADLIVTHLISHTFTTTRNQTFFIGLQGGLHAYVREVWKKPTEDTSEYTLDKKYTDPDVNLFITHACNVNPNLSGIRNQSYLFRGDWFLNSTKLYVVKKIIDYIDLKKSATNYDNPDEYLKDIIVYEEEKDSSKDQEFYLEVIKNILTKLRFVIGEIDICRIMKGSFEPFFLHNVSFKKIILNDIQTKLLSQRPDNKDNALMVAVKTGNKEEINRILNFIVDLKDENLNKKILEQVNKNNENIEMVATKFYNKQAAEQIRKALEN